MRGSRATSVGVRQRVRILTELDRIPAKACVAEAPDQPVYNLNRTLLHRAGRLTEKHTVRTAQGADGEAFFKNIKPTADQPSDN